MTGNKQMFSSLNTEIEGTVKFGDNSRVKIEGKGSILLECKNGEQRMISDVLYIPRLRSNILSIGQAEEGGCEILIKHGYCETMKTLFVGKMSTATKQSLRHAGLMLFLKKLVIFDRMFRD
ncbi:hypothetical protein E3N88_19791 [Mikania micrantha]|uniref:Retrovirus-related Pol polyprotein from transposon TNT 1-94-like beta-barrel domain-containing protein n=1 Tax=Mikania micrantha TaxID=192012 RepID=A0A5N6NRL9_9ASTR|nr:hypothetical protein E3N88_19791 [Mikania micrantha]